MKSHEEYLVNCAKNRKDFNEYEILTEYAGGKSQIRYRHNCGFEKSVRADHFANNHCGCPICKKQNAIPRVTHEEFLLKAAQKRNDWQEYEWLESYTTAKTKIKYRHSCGTEWSITPSDFLCGYGCPTCGAKRSSEARKITHEDFLEECRANRSDFDDYTLLSKYQGCFDKIKYQHICGYEGEMNVNNFKRGVGRCPACGKVKREQTVLEKYGVKNVFQLEIFKKKAEQTNLEKYGTKNPMQSEVIQKKVKQTNLKKYGVEHIFQSEDFKKKTKWTNLEKYGVENPAQCKEVQEKISLGLLAYNHGEEQAVILSDRALLRELLQSRTFTTAQLAKRFNYKRTGQVLNLLHKYNLYDLVGHKPSISSFHADFLYHIPTDDINNRDLLDGLEIDCYYPDQKIGIELNGTYWHSENTVANKDKDYHNHKTKLAAERGIRLIHIFEHQWYNEKDKWINFTLNALGYNEEKIYARETYVAEINVAEYRRILDENHLQSYAPASIKFGLYSKKTNELVFVMGFKKAPGSSSDYTLERMASSMRVVGGANKCLKYFIDNYKPSSIETFCDTTTFTGNVYEKMGFEKVAEIHPMYSWVNMDNEVIKRRSAQKANVIKKFGLPQDYMNKTENEIMTELGYYKIWGCNLIKYRRTFEKTI